VKLRHIDFFAVHLVSVQHDLEDAGLAGVLDVNSNCG
jgi:hypothetical protein